MDEEDTVHVHNGILLRHQEKKRNNAIFNNMDGLGDSNTK